ncbi:hypothetical protein ACP70R_047124 [Stipagrostis hirtigluma subsp. patula]
MNGLENQIFTKKVICATDGDPLKICIVVNDQQGTYPHRLLSAKIKVVVLDGDFNRHNQECWTSQEFKDCIVLPRDKVGPILTGVSELTLKNGDAYLHGATFIDNSKFVRSGKFRLAVMVDENLGERVLRKIVGARFGDNYTPFSDLNDTGKVTWWDNGSKVHTKNMTFVQPDYEISNAKPRPINQDMLQGLSVLEDKLADLMQGQRLIAEEERNVCPTVDQQGTSGSNSKQCTLKRLGSVRVTQNGEDESFDISLYLDSGSEQYCASTSADDITGLVTLCCPTTAANEITGSVVLKQASLTKDREVYATHLTDNDTLVPQLCEEQQQMQAHFGASICAVRALADCPIYSRHSSFTEAGCHEMPALGAEPAV